MDDAKNLLDSTLDQLAKASESQDAKDRVARILGAMAKFHTYSIGNQILIAIQAPDATQVAGFETWKKHGRFVKKGEKGIRILAPISYKRTVEKNGEEVEVGSLFFKTVCVFDVSQTDGKPLPDLYEKIDGDFPEQEGRLLELCAEKGIKVTDEAMARGTFGYSEGGHIALATGMDSGRRVLVLAHELAHEILHKRKDRVELTKQQKEADAEAVAYVVGIRLGIPNPDSGAYLNLYGIDAKTLRERYASISQAVKEIVSSLERRDRVPAAA